MSDRKTKENTRPPWRLTVLRLLANLILCLGAAVLILVILDFFNPMLGFLVSTYSKILIALLALLALIAGILAAVLLRKLRWAFGRHFYY